MDRHTCACRQTGCSRGYTYEIATICPTNGRGRQPDCASSGLVVYSNQEFTHRPHNTYCRKCPFCRHKENCEACGRLAATNVRGLWRCHGFAEELRTNGVCIIWFEGGLSCGLKPDGRFFYNSGRGMVVRSLQAERN